MLRKRSLLIALPVLLLAVFLALSGCGGGEKEDAVLRVGIDTSLSTCDPHMTGDYADMVVLLNLFDPLVRRNNSGELQPSLALSWELIEDTVWEFKLREGVKFHNGEEFNADSVKYSLERVFKEGSKSPIQELRSIESVEVVDPLTVHITTKEVDPFVPDRLALYAGLMVPPQYIEEKGEDYFHSNPIGTGPFIFKEWVKDGHLSATANKDYWNGAPKVPEIMIKFITDGQARVANLLSGDLDIINQVPAQTVENIKGNEDLRVDVAEGIRIQYLSIAYPDGPLSNKLVRQAISYAVDTQSLIDVLLEGYGLRIAAPVNTSNFGSDVDLAPYPYDLEKARELLAEAGYADGFEIEMNSREGYLEVAQSIAQMLDKINIKVKVTPLPVAEYEDKYEGGELAPLWNLGYSIWQGDPTTLIGSFFYTGMPRAKYYSDELDRMIDDMRVMTDIENRKEALHEILTVLHEDAPWVYLFQQNDLYGVKKNVSWKVPYDQIIELKTAEFK